MIFYLSFIIPFCILSCFTLFLFGSVEYEETFSKSKEFLIEGTIMSFIGSLIFPGIIYFESILKFKLCL